MILAATNEEIKKWVGVTANFEPENLIHSGNEVKKNIIDIIGDDEFNLLVSNYPGSFTPEQTAIFSLVQKAIVNLAMLHYADNGGQLEITQAGFHINTSAERKTAFEWQIKQFKRGCMNDGFSALQDLLIFLWDSPTNTYTAWRASANKDEHLKFFCNDAITFSKGYNIKKSYSLFCELKDSIAFVEMQYIIPIIQPVVAADLKQKIKNFSLNSIEKELLEKVNFALATMTIFHAIPRTSTVFTESGIFEPFSSMNLSVNASNPARDSGLSLKLRDAENIGNKYLVELGRFMVKNTASFPLYESPAESSTNINNINNGIYVAGL